LNMYEGAGLSNEAPLMTYREEGGGWSVWGREKATKRLRQGIEFVGRKWKGEGRGVGANLDPKEFALHSGRIGGATRLAAMGVPDWMIQKEGRWKSDAYKIYVRGNMDQPAVVSGALEARPREFERQQGLGTRWG